MVEQVVEQSNPPIVRALEFGGRTITTLNMTMVFDYPALITLNGTMLLRTRCCRRKTTRGVL